ncbi:MAG: leucine-rich repeat domain-containing protein [Spirochaetaceae bacterium]|nr:leucine-rich repeat domain-containing protein [Spirochaetaceae bacterium]
MGTHGSPSGPAYYADGPFSRVTAISFPPSLRILGESLFQGNEALTEIELPEGLVKIDYAAFAGAKNLKSVKLPSTLRTIGTYAFQGTALESIDLPAGLDEIGSAAFYGTSIKRVTLPASVSVSSGFSGIKTLEYADFSKADIYGSRAKAISFAGCGGLKEVYLPETLLELDEFPWSFKGVGGKLKKLVVYAPVPPVLHKVSSELSQFTGSFKIYVPDSSVNRYKNAAGASAGWSQYADKIRPVSALGAA